MRWNETSYFPIDVQFEDIDGGGVVHHPNYLKYLERARCHAMREIGVPFDECLKDGIAFVVAELNSKYLRPLTYGQRIYVHTRLVAMRKSSFKVFQKIMIDDLTLPEIRNSDQFFIKESQASFFAQLRLVAVDLKHGKPIPVPEKIRVNGGYPTPSELSMQLSASDVRLLPFHEDR